MKAGLVPPPPIAIESKGSESTKGEARENAATSPMTGKLDAAFLGRIYRSMLWFAAIVLVLVGASQRDAAFIGSIAGGFALAALLLRTQEVLVRAVVRPKSEMGGLDARLLLVLVLPLKYIVVIGVLALINYFGLMRPAMLALGFFLGQLVIVAKVIGWFLTRSTSGRKASV